MSSLHHHIPHKCWNWRKCVCSPIEWIGKSGGGGVEENWKSHLIWTGCVWRWLCNRNSIGRTRSQEAGWHGSRGFMISCTSPPLLHGKGRELWCVQASGGDTCRGSRPCRLSSSLTHGHDVVSHTLTGLRHITGIFRARYGLPFPGWIKNHSRRRTLDWLWS